MDSGGGRIASLLLPSFLALLLLAATPAQAEGVNCQQILSLLTCGMGCGFTDPVRAQQLANIYNTYCLGGASQQPSVGDYCSNGGTCPVGSRCSWLPGRCVPSDKVDCGNYFCDQGLKCARDTRYRACLQPDQVDCGSYNCNPGNKCSKAGCIPEDAVACSKTGYCNAGRVCWTAPEDIPDVAAKGQGLCPTPEDKARFEQQLADLKAQKKREAEDKKQAAEKAAEEAKAAKLKAIADAKEAAKEQQRQDRLVVDLRTQAQQLEASRISAMRRAAVTAPKGSSITCETAIEILQDIANGRRQRAPQCGNQPVQPPPSGPKPVASPCRTAMQALADFGSGRSYSGAICPSGSGNQPAVVAQPSPPQPSGTVSLNPNLSSSIATLKPPTGPANSKPQPSGGAGSASPNNTFSYRAAVDPQQSTGVWQRLTRAYDFANSSVQSDPNYQEGKKDLQVTSAVAAIGCAGGGVVLGTTAAASTGGSLTLPGAGTGCVLGAEKSLEVLGAAEFGIALGQGVVDGIQQNYEKGVRQTVSAVVSQVADTPSKTIPISSSIKLVGSWGTYFVYGFYNGVPSE